jgi:holin-like protein
MLSAFAILLGFQLLGEVLARGLHLGIPGPVIGMSLLAVACLLSSKLRLATEAAARVLLSNLSLLFLPAAVGVVQFLPLLKTQGLAIGAAIVGSTILALAVTALVFRFVVHRMKLEDRE